MRQIAVYLRFLPPDSACARVEAQVWPPWTRDQHQLDDLRMVAMAAAGVEDVKPHPDRTRKGPAEEAAQKRKRREAERRTLARMAERARKKQEAQGKEG